MNVSVHTLPVADRQIADTWNAFDEARRKLETMYADQTSTREERLQQCRLVATNWQRWQTLFLRGAA